MTNRITIGKIKNRFKIIENEISQLVEDQYVFEKYKEYIKNSENVDKGSEFLFWIAKNYQILSVINVCKQVDEDSRSESLVNLLKDIKNNKKLFTLKWYRRQWKPVPIAKTNKKNSRLKEAEECFKKFAIKNNNLISSQKINKDIKEIKQAICGVRFGKERQSVESLKKYRNKRGAHFASGNKKAIVPMEKLFDAIDLLEKITIKYNLLLNQAGMNTLNIDDYIELDKIFRK
ncbi:MAG: hypothetical protein KAI67_00055 [Candidatus Pacebacteria bacterium]|nr:hypothetical protein [Candidatus Paceibacterota bacterium]